METEAISAALVSMLCCSCLLSSIQLLPLPPALPTVRASLISLLLKRQKSKYLQSLKYLL